MKKLWSKIQTIFLSVFGGARKVEDFLKNHVDDAVSIINQIKFWIDSPMASFVIQLSGAKYRDKLEEVQAKVKVVLAKVLDGVLVGQECINMATFEEKLQCAVAALRGKTKSERQEFYRNLSAGYVQEMSKEATKTGEPIPESMARTMVEVKYQEVLAEEAQAEKAAAKKSATKKAAPKKAAKKK